MPFDEELADRIRTILKGRRGVGETRMFGGICFTMNGNMCCGIRGDDLVLRLGEEATRSALKEQHTRPMDLTGKVMKSMVFVSPSGFRSDAALEAWMELAVGFTRTLPPKMSMAKR